MVALVVLGVKGEQTRQGVMVVQAVAVLVLGTAVLEVLGPMVLVMVMVVMVATVVIVDQLVVMVALVGQRGHANLPLGFMTEAMVVMVEMVIIMVVTVELAEMQMGVVPIMEMVGLGVMVVMPF
jgi:hypothetical protein